MYFRPFHLPTSFKFFYVIREFIPGFQILLSNSSDFFSFLLNIISDISVRKLKFHERYPAFPGSLVMDKEALMMVGNNDAGNFYEMCIEFLDYLEDIINLETGVFDSLGKFFVQKMIRGRSKVIR